MNTAPLTIVLHEKVFRRVSLLGQGGVGVVYKYTHVNRGERINVAIKFALDIDLQKEHDNYRKIVSVGCQQYFTNYYFGGKTDQPVVYTARAGGTEGTGGTGGIRGTKRRLRTFQGYAFVATQLMDTDVHQWSMRYREAEWYYDECFKIILHAAKAISCLLRHGLLYNDLKLNNVFLKIDGEGKVLSCKLGDVGCASKIDTVRPCYTPGLSTNGLGTLITERVSLQTFILTLVDNVFHIGVTLSKKKVRIETGSDYYDLAFALLYFITGVLTDFTPLIKFLKDVMVLDKRYKRTNILYKIATMVLQQSNPTHAGFLSRISRRQESQVKTLIAWQQKRSLDLVIASEQGDAHQTKYMIDSGAIDVDTAAIKASVSPKSNEGVFLVLNNYISPEAAEKVILNGCTHNRQEIVSSMINSVDASWDRATMQASINAAAAHGNFINLRLVLQKVFALDLKASIHWRLYYAMKGKNASIIKLYKQQCKANKTDNCMIDGIILDKDITKCGGAPACDWNEVMSDSFQDKNLIWVSKIITRIKPSEDMIREAAHAGYAPMVDMILKHGNGDDAIKDIFEGAAEGGQLHILKMLDSYLGGGGAGAGAGVGGVGGGAGGTGNVRDVEEGLIIAANIAVAEYMIDKGATELRDASLHALTIKNIELFKYLLDRIPEDDKNDDYWIDVYRNASGVDKVKEMLEVVDKDTADKIKVLNSDGADSTL